MREILNTVSRKSTRHLNFPRKILNKARSVIQNSGSLRFGEKLVGSGFAGLGAIQNPKSKIQNNNVGARAAVRGGGVNSRPGVNTEYQFDRRIPFQYNGPAH
jgi:hypothetical protein